MKDHYRTAVQTNVYLEEDRTEHLDPVHAHHNQLGVKHFVITSILIEMSDEVTEPQLPETTASDPSPLD